MQALPGNIDYTKTISEIVRADYRTADVFKKYGINYCCGGQVQLQEACQIKNIPYEEVRQALENATRVIHISNTLPYESWRLDFLTEYIIQVHHSYLKNSLPAMEQHLLSFINGHKKKYPELENVLTAFQQLAPLLLSHMESEETIIFPYIKQIENTLRRKEVYGSLFIKTMYQSLTTIEKEHQQISDLLLQLRSQTNNYQFPANACTNHQVIYHKLRELDDDLMQHTHLESSILYSRARAIEKELLELSVSS